MRRPGGANEDAGTLATAVDDETTEYDVSEALLGEGKQHGTKPRDGSRFRRLVRAAYRLPQTLHAASATRRLELLALALLLFFAVTTWSAVGWNVVARGRWFYPRTDDFWCGSALAGLTVHGVVLAVLLVQAAITGQLGGHTRPSTRAAALACAAAVQAWLTYRAVAHDSCIALRLTRLLVCRASMSAAAAVFATARAYKASTRTACVRAGATLAMLAIAYVVMLYGAAIRQSPLLDAPRAAVNRWVHRSVERTAVQRVHIAGHGDGGYFTRMGHVCMTSDFRDFVAYGDGDVDGDDAVFLWRDNYGRSTNVTHTSTPFTALNPRLQLLNRRGGHYVASDFTGTQSELTFSQHTLHAKRGRLVGLAAACVLGGVTLLHDNSAGVPGHIGHFVEDVIKWHAFVGDDVPRVDRVLFLKRNKPLVNDWERSFVLTGIGGARRRVRDGDDGALPSSAPASPVEWSLSQMSALRRNHSCPRVCFEEAVLAQKEHQFQMSSANSDAVRERVYAHCAIPAANRPVVHARTARVVVVRRASRKQQLHRFFHNLSEISRVADALRVTVNATFVLDFTAQVVPDSALGTFCEQARLFAGADIIVGEHGAALSNILFMRPNAVVIELGRFSHPVFKVMAGFARVNMLEWTGQHLDFDAVRAYLRFAHAELLGRDAWHAHSPCMAREPPLGNGRSVGKFHHLNRRLCTPPVGY
jgi:hypothetical protein